MNNYFITWLEYIVRAKALLNSIFERQSSFYVTTLNFIHLFFIISTKDKDKSNQKQF